MLVTRDCRLSMVYTNRMLVLPDIPPHGEYPNGSQVDVPAVDKVALGHCMHDAGVDGVAVNELDLGESDPLLKPR